MLATMWMHAHIVYTYFINIDQYLLNHSRILLKHGLYIRCIARERKPSLERLLSFNEKIASLILKDALPQVSVSPTYVYIIIDNDFLPSLSMCPEISVDTILNMFSNG